MQSNCRFRIDNCSGRLGNNRSPENSPSCGKNAKCIFNYPPRPTEAIVENSSVLCSKRKYMYIP